MMINEKKKIDIITYYSEPIGSVAPKVNIANEVSTLTMIRVRLMHTITLMCPAQAYPVPVFR